MSHEIRTKTVTDIDGNSYSAIQIGTQVWMGENLRVSQFRNGDPIPTTSTPTQDLRPENENSILKGKEFHNTPPSIHDEPSPPTYQWAHPETLQHNENYGRLYTWAAAADPRNISPQGWRLPSQKDWDVLIDFLGGKAHAGGKLKAQGTDNWKTPNSGATNESGFGALPAGGRDKDGVINGLGLYGAWWTANPGVYLHIEHDDPYVYRNYYYRSRFYGFSIRCIKNAV